MRAILANLMVFTLVFHAALGCCWHHAHHCGHEASTAVCEAETCCDHHEHHGLPGEEAPDPCGCQVECRGICTYVAPQKVQFETTVTVVAFAAVAGGSPFDSEQFITGFARNSAGPVDFGPPLRLHLLHQIVLI